mmetsp:Transcript_42974/g.93566  ORF Transcript_42974/g.93566 Transcript_42974/m.93566 type:complete len:364 (+) Transcript_42974:55-1146(+)|eukprot:CAMPEP_0170583468 /NCGR_PEP_ID=MMETSP0224-20130122/8152_1 /TAXON_ID=285029 /ORGANISM="Togula jolla, Strain CCCM 725" /LENGTH=363 /DNA_ID=CAMNT_0010906799 /DNA_START=54 /DNA_END=1145 /DNA_ORIENTATION=-
MGNSHKATGVPDASEDLIVACGISAQSAPQDLGTSSSSRPTRLGQQLEVRLAHAIETGDVLLVIEVMEQHGTTGLAAGEFESLRAFADNELCKALIEGQSSQVIHCTHLLEILDLRSSDRGRVRGSGSVTERRQARSRRSAPSSQGTSQRSRRRSDRSHAGSAARSQQPKEPNGPLSKSVRAFWEAEVEAAKRGGNMAELMFTLQMAEEAGIPAANLASTRRSMQPLAQGELADALRRGDPADVAQAFRIAEELGLPEVHLAEARLMAAEYCRDPYYIGEELRCAELAGVPALRLAEARQLMALLREAELEGRPPPAQALSQADWPTERRDSGTSCSTRPTPTFSAGQLSFATTTDQSYGVSI